MTGGITTRTAIPMREPSTLSPEDHFQFGSQWNEFKYVSSRLSVANVFSCIFVIGLVLMY